MMRSLLFPSLHAQKHPRRSPYVFGPPVVLLVILTLLTLTVVPQAHAASLGRTAQSPKKLTPTQIEAARKALKQQIKVTPASPTNVAHATRTTQPVTTGSPHASNLPAYNNTGISDPINRSSASFDGVYHSYSAQALQDVGLVPGISVASQNITFIWPNVPSGQADNYLVSGQVIPVSAQPGAATVGFLGAADFGSASGTATLTYTDGTTSTFTLGFTDWWVGAAQFGNEQVAHMTTINTKHGTKSGNYYVYSALTSLNTSKTLQSVTLPTSVSPGQLHVFAVGVSGPAFNNVGVSDDANQGSGNYDGGGTSYSAQTLGGPNYGIAPNHQFDVNGIGYIWPDAPSGTPDNYQANGQVLPIVPVPNATRLGFLGSTSNGSASGTATMTFTDGSTSTFTLGLSEWGNGSPAFGNQIAATLPYRNAGSGRQNFNIYLFTAEFAIPSGKTLLSVTLPSTITGGQLHVFAIGTGSVKNGLGTSNDSQPANGDLGGDAQSYSIQAMEAAGIHQGQPFSFNGVTFTWPASYGQYADNYLATGQVIPVTPVANATTLAFLGSGNHGSPSGTATLTYTDGTTSTFTLTMTNWWNTPLAPGDQVAAQFPVSNAVGGHQNGPIYLYYTETALQAGKTLQSVTLPTSLTPASSQMNIFAISTRSQFNNTGISDNSNTATASLDGRGTSYSEQDFTDPTIAGWNPGDTLTYQGINYIWPGWAGLADNYQAAGQTIPVSSPAGATTIGFVGAADSAPSSSGTATLNYTDGSTSTFPLNLTDWWLSSGAGPVVPGNHLFAILPHYNDAQGTHAQTVYLFEMETPLNSNKTLQSVTLPSTVDRGHLHLFMMGTRTGENYLNNIGTSDDSNTMFANYDGNGNSYSIQALEANNISEGQPVTLNGVNFTWPASYSVIPDNYQAAGQPIPVTPVTNANTLAFLGSATYGPSQGTATITYTDGTTQPFSLGFTDWSSSSISYGNVVVATVPYVNTPSGQANGNHYLYYTETPISTSKTVQSVTLPTTVNQGAIHVFAVGTRAGLYYNNAGISDDSYPTAANMDTRGNSFSAQALQGVGLTPGKTFMFNGISFTWPNAASGLYDNYQAVGQTLPVTPVANASTLAFIGAAAGGSTSGTATLQYTDGTTQTFSLGLTDWWGCTPQYGNLTVVTMPYVNTPSGKRTGAYCLSYADVSLQAGKTIQSVTLPALTGSLQLNIFAIGTREATPYNNAGISNDSYPTAANMDTRGNSFSAQALQGVGLTPGKTFMFNGISFTWPNAASGFYDNYQAVGQTLPVTPVANASTLAFIGAAAGGSISGTATLQYTDGTTQTFSLGLTDWWGCTPQFGNLTVVTMPYVNTPAGKRTGTYCLSYADVSLQAGKTIQSVTLPALTGSLQLNIFAIGTRAASPYNNAGISDDTNRLGSNYDGSPVPGSWSAQALQQAGITPGASLTYNGVTFTWPNVPSGQLDNYQANGQVIPVTPVASATTLAFLGSATYGPSQGTATITYTDGSTQTFRLGFTDWSSSSISYGNVAVATVPYVNTPAGQANGNHYLYYTETSLQAGKTIQSVTLPTTVNQGAIHVFAVGTRAALSQSPGMVGYWPFNEGNGPSALDVSGNDNSGVVNGATWTTGRIGHGLSFNGSNNSVDINKSVVNTSNSYTVMAWVQLSDLSTFHTAVSQDGTNISGFFLQYVPSSTGGAFALTVLNADSVNATAVRATASSAPSANTWYHLVGVYNASTNQIQFYVNGTLQSTQTVPAAWNATGETVIGRAKWNGGSTDFWPGLIDEARLYNYALTAQQINTVYQTDQNNLAGGLTGYWQLNEGNGLSTQDASGNNNSGQINGATWATGHSGNALNFSGTNSSVDINKSVVNTSTSFTVAAWVQISDLSTFHTAVSQDGNNISGFYLQYMPSSTGGAFAFSMDNPDSTSSTIVHAAAPFTPSTNTWYHLVGVYNASTNQIQLYVNGTLQSTQTVSAAWNAAGETVIGRAKWNGGPVDFWSGLIDEVRLYNYALNAQQISALYQAN